METYDRNKEAANLIDLLDLDITADNLVSIIKPVAEEEFSNIVKMKTSSEKDHAVTDFRKKFGNIGRDIMIDYVRSMFFYDIVGYQTSYQTEEL